MARFIRDRRRCFAEIGAAAIIGSASSVTHTPELAVAVALLGVIMILAAGA